MNQKRKLMRNNHIKGTVIVLKEGEDVNRALRRFKNKIEDYKKRIKPDLTYETQKEYPLFNKNIDFLIFLLTLTKIKR